MTAEFEKDLDRDLEIFFEAARKDRGDASPDLLSRVLADAYAEQDAQAEAVPTSSVAPRTADTSRSLRGVFAGLFDAIGGWPAVAGLATAAMAGVWIGYNPPAVFDTLAMDFMESSYGVSLGAALPEYDAFLADG